MAQALPSLGVIRVRDDGTDSAFLVEKICAQGNLTLKVIKQVAHGQRFMDADVTAIAKPAGTKVPTLDETLGQHQG